MGLSAGMNLSSISRSLYNVFIYVILVCCLCLMHASFPTTVATSRLGGNETDRLALLAFKAKISNDPLKVMSSWNGSIHFCQWHGVMCGRRHKRVIMLDLSSQKLFGSISPHIGNLSFLRAVYLQNNIFENEIPPEVGRLRRLQLLSLYNNSISGNIPVNVSACTNLLGFVFSYNKLVGKIPKELGSLSKLKLMSIGHNNLIGNIPHSFINLSSLEKIGADENNLSGSVPEALGQLKKLTFISLTTNMLSGTIPPSIFNLSSLMVFSVTDNHRITGSLPSDIGITLPSLRHLGLGSNQFNGSIPLSISNVTNLEMLDIGPNNFIGKIPTMERLHKLRLVMLALNHLGSGGIGDLSFISSLTNATNLRVLSMDRNNFGGMLPQSIGNLSTKLEVLAVADNHIFGSIPGAAIGNLINLTWLNMWGNHFTGNIPPEIGKLQKLNRLYLNANNFSGNIPPSLGNLSVLIDFNVGRNNLQGSVPSSIEKCQNLLLLDVSENKLSGTTLHLFNLMSLTIDLSQNHFTGSLPVEVGNLKNLGSLDVSHNMLSGEIPSTIGGCVSLEGLSMSSNFFQGSIPASLSNLKAIQELDLSRNNLSGKIPEYFTDFKLLQKLNLSYNNFDGMVPIKGVFGNASAISIIGNSKLCGGIPELQLPRCNLTNPKKRGSTFSFRIVIAIASGLLVVTFVLCALCVCWCRKKREKPSTTDSGSLLLRVSYQSLHRATNGFSESNLIGVGSFGTVYEGTLIDHDRKKIAVKVLNLLHRGASKSFINECEALRNIRHRNLVKIISACSSVDYRNNDFKALVYEFMVNGNLDEWLHPIGGQSELPKNLSLVQRLHIAIDVACALDYLHHHCQTPIVHCDLKPSNVLLDDNMTAHVSDFGISRFHCDANYNDSENQTSSVGIRGSVGYMPPEYGMGSEVSTSGDVYSYGILLLEMFTGKRPTDEMFKDGLNLHNYVKMALPERVINIADSVLQQREEGETSTNNTHDKSHVSSYKIEECLASIFRIGIACSTESPSERLDISDVVTKLHVNMDNLFGTRQGRRITTTVQS